MLLSPKPHLWFTLLSLVALWSCNGDTAATSETASTAAEVIEKAGQYYQEAHRPQVHFTPEKAWMNDPNGLVFHNGLYHLYYQYNPDSTVWGPMHWGHATSTDLVQWAHHDIALFPSEQGTIFSGSIVVDKGNTTGFGTAENPALIAIYTQHSHSKEDDGDLDFQTQGISYSTDGGFNWTRYAENPVLPNPGLKDFRDPKVIWHKESERWIMALAALDRVKFYTSPDLKTWEFTSDFGPGVGSQTGIWECPDLFPIRDDRSGELQYALIVSVQDGAPNGGTGTSYFIGQFDGKKFTPTVGHRKPLWLDYGTDNYAFVTFSDGPTSENRRLGIGWMSNWQYAQQVPTTTWRSAMTAARVLTLHTTEDGLRLKSTLVPDYMKIRERKARFNRLSDVAPSDLFRTLGDWATDPLEISIATPGGVTPNFSIELASSEGDTVSFGYDKEAALYFIDRSKINSKGWSDTFSARHTAKRKTWTTAPFLNILLDRSSIELMGDNGFTPMTDIYFLGGELTSMKLYGEEGISGTIYELGPKLTTPVSVSRIQRPRKL
ncbi:MAG: glycoside hydrolase family 32 protein [Saprospiraceae bacterium]